jgi:hypothetical protein
LSLRDKLDGAKGKPHLGAVPGKAKWRCDRCFGPKQPDYAHCYGCSRLDVSAPDALLDRVRPITTAAMDGPWYALLIAYKRPDQARWPFLVALAGGFIETHDGEIGKLLGGDATMVCVVPSTKGVSPEKQPLYRVATMMAEHGDGIPPAVAALEHGAEPKQRLTYNPQLFSLRQGVAVKKERVILLDDSWASGATAISAAGTLIKAGASAVMTMPIARLYNANYWRPALGEGNPYEKAIAAPWDVDAWPTA